MGETSNLVSRWRQLGERNSHNLFSEKFLGKFAA
jgi:hypothetical protein